MLRVLLAACNFYVGGYYPTYVVFTAIFVDHTHTDTVLHWCCSTPLGQFNSPSPLSCVLKHLMNCPLLFMLLVSDVHCVLDGAWSLYGYQLDNNYDHY